MNAPLTFPVIPAADAPREIPATLHVIEVWGAGRWVREKRSHESRAAALAAIAADAWLLRLPADERRVREIPTAAPDVAVCPIDIDIPDGFAEAYPGADIITLGRLNHERKEAADAAFDARPDRLSQAMEG